MSTRTINSKGSGGLLRFPSIEDDASRFASARKEYLNEPFNNVDPVGKRGLGKVEPPSQ